MDKIIDPVTLRALHVPISKIKPTTVFKNGRIIYGKNDSVPPVTVSHKVGDGFTQYSDLREQIYEADLSQFIQNQFLIAQPANLWISGQGKIGTIPTDPLHIVRLQELNATTLQNITNNGNTSTNSISVGTVKSAISNLYFIGDSITVGYGLVDSTLRWSTLLATQLKAIEINHGVTGMTVQDGSPVGYGGSILTQLSLIPNYDNGNSYLAISLGTNDIGFQGVPGQTGYSISGYISGITAVLSNATGKGWPTSRIIFSSPPFIGNYAYWTASTTTSNTATSISYRDALKSFCTTNNTKFLDTYAITTANGGSSLLQADGVHYNIAGNRILATAAASLLNTTTIYGDAQITGQLAVGSIKDGPQFYSTVRTTGNAVNQFVEIGHFKYSKNISDFIDITINSTDLSFLLPIYNGDGYNAASYKYHIAVNSWFPNNTWVNVNANTITGYSNGWEVYYQHAFQLQMMLVTPSFSDTRIYFRIKNLNTQQQTVYIQLTTTDYANSSYFIPTLGTGSDATNYNSIGSTTYAATSSGSIDEFYRVWPQLALNNAPVNTNGTYQLLVRNSSITPSLTGNVETISTIPISMLPGTLATLAGTETFSNKTFSNSPIVPDATLSAQAVNKGQLDLKENLSNKVITLDNSTTHYPSTSAVTTALSAKQNSDGWIVQQHQFNGVQTPLVISGSASFTESSTGLVISGGNGTFNNYADMPLYSMLEDYQIELSPFVSSISGAGIGVGIDCAYTEFAIAKVDLSGGANNGKVMITRNKSSYPYISNALTYSSTDLLQIILRRSKNSVFVYFKNLTQGTQVSTSFDTTPTAYLYGSGSNVNRIGKPAIYAFGGTQTFSNTATFTYKSYAHKNPKLVIMGTSIDHGYAAGTIENIWSNLRGSGKFTIDLLTAASATSADMVNGLPELLIIKPEWLCIGTIATNDAIQGISTTTTQANILTIHNFCIANDIKEIWNTTPPTGNSTYNTSIVANNNYITTTIQPTKVVDFYTLLQSGGLLSTIYDAGDGVHLSPLAHSLLADYFITQTKDIFLYDAERTQYKIGPAIIPTGNIFGHLQNYAYSNTLNQNIYGVNGSIIGSNWIVDNNIFPSYRQNVNLTPSVGSTILSNYFYPAGSSSSFLISASILKASSVITNQVWTQFSNAPDGSGVPGAPVEAFNTGISAIAAVFRNTSGNPYVTFNSSGSEISRITANQATGALEISGSLSAAGGIFSGNVTVPTPTLGGHAVNKDYADSLVAGLLDDRGSYNASANTYPATGGSGTAGAILKGDLWSISGPGTLGGIAVNIGDWVRCVTDSPGQTSTNWAIVEGNLGYTPENMANKTGSISSSTTLYPTVKAIQDYAVNLLGNYTNPSWITSLPWSKITATPSTLTGYGITDAELLSNKQNSLTIDGTGVKYPTVDAVNAKLSAGQTIAANISGNALTANTATNSLQWNGATLSPNGATNIGSILVFDLTGNYYTTAQASQVKSFLGLGSNAFSSTAYQPLENQRLGTTNSPSFETVTATNTGYLIKTGGIQAMRLLDGGSYITLDTYNGTNFTTRDLRLAGNSINFLTGDGITALTINSSKNATFAGAVIAPQGIFTDGTQGLVIGAYIGAGGIGTGGFGAIYPYGVTPNNTNYIFAAKLDNVQLNSLSIVSLTVNGVSKLDAISTGVNITGNANISGTVTANAGFITGTSGNVRLTPGDATHSGYVQFYKGDGTTRIGYIGFSNTDMVYSTENGAIHSFTGQVSTNSAFSPNTTQTTVNGSSSGNIVASMPFQGSSYKKVLIYCPSLSGTATYTFPVPFVILPQLSANGNPIQSLSNTAITVGSGSAGWIILEGY